MWVVSTSALMIGIPWALAFVDEQSVLEMEAEQKARESAGEVCFCCFIINFSLNPFLSFSKILNAIRQKKAN